MTQTILYGSRETIIANARADGDRLRLPVAELPGATGWELKPQGLCQGDTCVPIPPNVRSEWLDESAGLFDLTAFARHLGQPLVRDEARAGWAFGDAVSGSDTASGSGPVSAPDFTLPDLDGKLHSLSDYRGKKVFLFSWASW